MQVYFAHASLATKYFALFINHVILPEVIDDFISLIALRSLMPVLLMEIYYRYEKILIPEKSY